MNLAARGRIAGSVFALCVLAMLVGACATSATSKALPERQEAAGGFASSLTNAREAGRRQAEDILAVYAELPARQVPGIAGLRLDIASAFSRLKREGRAHLTSDEVEELTVHNTDFWQAWFEFQPQDGSLLMLQASLLLDAGELFRASLILTVGVQALPLNGQERMLWMAQQARVNWTVFRRLDDLQERERSWSTKTARRIAGLQAALREWPADGFAAEALVQALAGVKSRRDATTDEPPIALDPTVRAAIAPELAQLARHNPIAATRYAATVADAAEFGRLWAALVDEEQPPDERGMVALADLATGLGLPDVALLLRRVVDARRGFLAPVEMTAVQNALGRLLPADGQQTVLARLESGRLPAVQLTRPAEAPLDTLPGMDPRVHPLLAEHAVREVARETLWIDTAGENAEVRAVHLHERSIRNSNVGRCSAALTDLDAALAVDPKHPEWHVDRAVVLAKLGREAEAEAEFETAGRSASKSELLRSSLAVQRFGQQRFAEAEKLFRGAKKGEDNYAYAVIMGFYAGGRRGAADPTWLRQHRAAGGKEWPEPILRFIAGEIDRRALLDAAHDSSDLRTTEQQCEAFFGLAQMALIKGDRDTAQREFESCVQTGIVGFIEFDLAKRELARLNAHPTVPPEPVSPPAAEPNPPTDNTRLPLKTAAE